MKKIGRVLTAALTVLLLSAMAVLPAFATYNEVEAVEVGSDVVTQAETAASSPSVITSMLSFTDGAGHVDWLNLAIAVLVVLLLIATVTFSVRDAVRQHHEE